ncbi:MAG: peptidoglycan-binding domain-containing protein [Candidatus Paceibacterota bacterium]|jgi:peptidoglycan hydrolase-like protein with peptidoglycan-binding domain
MKKISLFLVAFIFVFGLFITNVNNVQAWDTEGTADCQPGFIFSPTTGNKCPVVEDASACQAGYNFNPITGKLCPSRVIEEPVPTPVPEPPICIQVLPVGTQGTAVVQLQQTLQEKGYYAGKIDGKYGPKTSAAVSNYRSFFPCPTTSSSVVISGVSGPQSLKVNETGTWKVSAYSKNNNNLNYYVTWGDEEVGFHVSAASAQILRPSQTATFTHKYSQTGTYTPTFTVTSPSTIQCIQAPCPGNGGSAKTSLSVKVGDPIETPVSKITVLSPNGGETWNHGQKYNITWIAPADAKDVRLIINSEETYWAGGEAGDVPRVNFVITNSTLNDGVYAWLVPNNIPTGKYKLYINATKPNGGLYVDGSDNSFQIVTNSLASSLTILSPNGGETWKTGTTQTIKWEDNSPIPPCLEGLPCVDPFVYDVSFDSNSVAYEVANDVKGFSYRWNISGIPAGVGKIRVCRSDGSYCDTSDSYFKITSSTVSTPSITVLSPNGGETFTKGSSGNTGDFLKFETSYSSPKKGSICKYIATSNNFQDWTRSRYYYVGCGYGYAATEGKDKITSGSIQLNSSFDVGTYYMLNIWTNEDGTGTAYDFSDRPFKIISSAVSTPSITVLSPNGQDVWKIGETRQISWQTKNISSPNDKISIYIVPAGDLSKNYLLVSGISNTGSYNYVIDDPAKFSSRSPLFTTGGRFEIFVCAQLMGDSNLCSNGIDYSDAFSIVAGANATITAERNSNSPAGNIYLGRTNTELLRFNVTAKGNDAKINNLNFELVGTAVPYAKNIKAYMDGEFIGDLAGLTNTSSWFYRAGVGTDIDIEKDDTVEISLKGDVSGSSEAISSWMYINLIGIQAMDLSNGQTIMSLSGLPVSGNQLNVVLVMPTEDPGPVVQGAQSFVFTQKLELGSTGNEVVELQKFLTELGYYNGVADGKFGLNTYKSLINYQKANNLKADGVVGVEVRALLNNK